MFKSFKKVLVAVSVLASFAFAFFGSFATTTDNNADTISSIKVSFGTTAEAKNWLKDFGEDLRDDYRREGRQTLRDIRKEHRQAAKKAREEQINISRADGDPRFKDDYLSDDEVVALRTLKSLPVGREIFLEVMKEQASDIRRMCNKLPEFSFVKYNKDEYKEYIGCTVFRRKVVY